MNDTTGSCMIGRLDILDSPYAVFQQIDVDGLDALRSKGPVVLLDVRTEAEVSRGVIAGTRHIVLNELPARTAELDAKAVTVVYCQSGGRSAQACEFLAGQGFETVYNLQGGILGWLRAGKPLSQLGG